MREDSEQAALLWATGLRLFGGTRTEVEAGVGEFYLQGLGFFSGGFAGDHMAITAHHGVATFQGFAVAQRGAGTVQRVEALAEGSETLGRGGLQTGVELSQLAAAFGGFAGGVTFQAGESRAEAGGPFVEGGGFAFGHAGGSVAQAQVSGVQRLSAAGDQG